MSIFKKLFGGEKAEVPPVEDVNNVEAEAEVQPVVDEVVPKTLNDIAEAKKKLEELEANKIELINTHRDNIEQLINLGVNETQQDSIKRSETYNEILNPIENDIQKIAEEISDIRENFDMQKSPKEILESRMGRLKKLCSINVKEFLNTEIGKKFLKTVESKGDNNDKAIKLDEDDAAKYSSHIYRFCNSNQETEIKENIEYKDFSSRDIRIKQMMDVVDRNLREATTGIV